MGYANYINSSDKPVSMPLISYIIPYYNLSVEMLRECIDSILASSLRAEDREIIVVDDGSATDIGDILKKCYNGIIYIRKSNGGPGSARNTGIKAATGEYIQFVDGDDKLNTIPYEHCLDILQHYKPDMVVFDFDRNENQSTSHHTIGPLVGIDYMLHNNIRASVCAYITKRAIINKLNFTDEIYHEDEEFTPQVILCSQSVYITDAKAYMYRRRPGSIMTSDDAENIEKRHNNTFYVLTKLKEQSLCMTGKSKEAFDRRIAQLTMDHIYNIILDTKSYDKVSKRIELLSKNDLFPLPRHNYTTKYKWFSRLSHSHFGLRLMIYLLPKLSRER